jgi:hypothetical protein
MISPVGIVLSKVVGRRHETVEAAKAQANFESGIDEVDWKEAEVRH